MLTILRRCAGAALAAALVFALPVSASAADATETPTRAAAEATQLGEVTPPDGFRTGDLTNAAPPDRGKSADTNAAWTYHITASCNGLEGPIRQGANFWSGATETASSGTPVSCTGGYVQGCGGSGNVVGCNWGMGDRIMLSTLVNDFALLAAHEFGHNWYGHSPAGCANWASAYEVMRPTMC
ncbi:hypothetical protein [Streptomyces oceani]|uniref:Uncharacterized protein n=1 Tax=Streptomyces oceani TaxID=1075402 RepID=A0A1E7KKW8_9ACTN|nr:hypothetical protein [Streptomyces oceani]OEV04530.1 hypothetical protein AN216_06350 [Streptomyces oceani]